MHKHYRIKDPRGAWYYKACKGCNGWREAISSQYQNTFDLETVPSALVNTVTGQIAAKMCGRCSKGRYWWAEADKLHRATLVESKQQKSFLDAQLRVKTATTV